MDERFRDSRIWAIAGVAGIIFLCLMLCGMGAMATMFLRSGTNLVAVPQVPAAPAEGAVVAPPVIYGPGGGGFFGFLAFGIGMFFKLLFFGLILLLVVGLVRRLFWGSHYGWGARRRWAHCHRPHKHGHGPPGGKEWKDRAHAWGPWAAYWCGEPWQEGDEPGGEQGEPGEAEPTYGGAE